MRRNTICYIPGVCSGSGPAKIGTGVFAVAVSGLQTAAGSFPGWARSAAGGSLLSPGYRHFASARPTDPPCPSAACGLESREEEVSKKFRESKFCKTHTHTDF